MVQTDSLELLGNPILASLLYSQIKEQNQGCYVWVCPDDQGILSIQRLIRNAPFKTSHTTDYHCTVMYSPELAPDVKVIDHTISAYIEEIVHWIDHKQRNIIVALLDSPGLQELHKDLTNQGLKHSYPEYNPHITIGYDIGPVDADVRIWLSDVNSLLSRKPLRIEFDPSIKGSSLG